MMTSRPDLGRYVGARLWEAADRLTEPARHYVERDDGTTTDVTTPSLLDQVVEAIAPSGEVGTGAGGGKPKSKPPLAVNAFDLWHEIRATVRVAMFRSGLAAVRTGRVVDDLHTLIRFLSAPHRAGDAERWVTLLERWHERALEATGAPKMKARPLTLPCPSCSAEWVTVDGDGDTVRRRAVSAMFDEADDPPTMRSLVCAACDAEWLRGPDLDALVGWAMSA